MKNGGVIKATITSIVCNATCSGIQKDNVFLIIQIDGKPPIHYPTMGCINMGAGDSMELPEGGYAFEFTYGFVVTAWDRDSYLFKGLDSPDFLFNFDACTTSTINYTQSIYNHNGAKYTYSRILSQ